MIAFLRGTVVKRDEQGVVLDVQGVGYRVMTCEDVGSVGSIATLVISEVIREDKFDLYGFSSDDVLALFEAFLKVQGVGPKSALTILRHGSPDSVRKAIFSSDVTFFTGISGIGKKTAQKIILDMRGVLAQEQEKVSDDLGEVRDALLGLGYADEILREVLPHVTGDSVENRVKSALKMLAKR